jgi:hypothetical protein
MFEAYLGRKSSNLLIIYSESGFIALALPEDFLDFLLVLRASPTEPLPAARDP